MPAVFFVIPAVFFVIPAVFFVIPAKAGIQSNNRARRAHSTHDGSRGQAAG